MLSRPIRSPAGPRLTRHSMTSLTKWSNGHRDFLILVGDAVRALRAQRQARLAFKGKDEVEGFSVDRCLIQTFPNHSFNQASCFATSDGRLRAVRWAARIARHQSANGQICRAKRGTRATSCARCSANNRARVPCKESNGQTAFGRS